MTMRVWTEEHCIRCGTCHAHCPRVFLMCRWTGMSEVATDDYRGLEDAVLRAAAACPVVNIQVEQDGVLVREAFTDAVLHSLRPLTADVLEVQVGGVDSPFRPGQYLTFRLRDRKGEFYRSYSVAGREGERLVFAVKVRPEGRGGKRLARMSSGERLQVSRPKGEFAVRTAPAGERSVFVATGTGLAPVLPMMEAIPASPKVLLFGVRGEADLFWLERARRVPGTEVRVALSRPGAAWAGLSGRVTAHLQGLALTPTTPVHVCGNPEMVREVVAWRQAQGHAADATVAEAFAGETGGAATGVGGTPWLRATQWVRSVHYYVSLVAAALLLFYGLTGFLANRAELFAADSAAGAEVAGQPLPVGLAADRDALVAWFRSHYRGEIDPGNMAEDGATLTFDAESAWGRCTFTVDCAKGTYGVTREAAPWTDALVALHRGRHANGGQRLLVDAAAGVLLVLGLTGLVLALGTPGVPRRRRLVAAGLCALSVLFLVLMLVNR